MAVQELYPKTQVTIGPVIDNGFYYDFSRRDPFTKDDLKKIEKKMADIVDRDEKTYREVWKRDDAVKHFLKIESPPPTGGSINSRCKSKNCFFNFS